MHRKLQTLLVASFVLSLASVALAADLPRTTMGPDAVARGEEIYKVSCIYCHGAKGEGDGPAAYFIGRDVGPRPRNFVAGIFKFRSTQSGDLPTDQDIFRTLTAGIPGYMPSFAGLSEEDRWAVIAYMKQFYAELETYEPTVLEIVGRPIPASTQSVSRGAEVYAENDCATCHGPSGRGDGERAAELKSDRGMWLPPVDITRPSLYKGGKRPVDVYRTIVTGLDGGAMPSYRNAFEGREDDLWHLVNYMDSLSVERR